jgi:hypothetical protein
VNRFLITIALIAFAVRGLVPAGWMPTGERAFEITICAGVETHTVWLDSKGDLHKQDPSKKVVPDAETCAFGAIAFAIASDGYDATTFKLLQNSALENVAEFSVAIGRGLAAPPPPATGPPILI